MSAFTYLDLYDGSLYSCIGSTIPVVGGTVTTNYAAQWDGTVGTGGWQMLDGGINTGTARSIIVVDPTRIYICGQFRSIGATTAVTHSNNFSVARWDGSKWNSLGTLGNTVTSVGGLATVYSMCYDSTNDILYAVGSFGFIYGVAAANVARFSGGVWSALSGGANNPVQVCTVDGAGNLYIGGSFGGVYNGASFVSNTSGFAKWNTSSSTWESMGAVNTQTYSIRYASDVSSMYVGGNFTSMGGVANTRLVARYDLDDNTWNSVGDFSAGTVVYNIVYASNSALYVGGTFTSYGTDIAYRSSDGSWTDYGRTTGGYTVDPDVALGPLSFVVDSLQNIYLRRNAGESNPLYILQADTTVYERSDAMTSAVDIGTRNLDIAVPDISLNPHEIILTYASATSIIFANTGGVASAVSITPSLPSGLSVSIIGEDVVITGTPSSYDIVGNDYTVSASNTAGFSTTPINIKIHDQYITRLTNYYNTTDISQIAGINITSTADLSPATLSVGANTAIRRNAVIDLLFTRPNNTSIDNFKAAKTDLSLTNFNSTNARVCRVESSLNFDNLELDTGIYFNISGEGDNAVCYNVGSSKKNITFTSSGNGMYYATINGTQYDQDLVQDNIYTIEGYKWAFDSVYSDIVPVLYTSGYYQVSRSLTKISSTLADITMLRM